MVAAAGATLLVPGARAAETRSAWWNRANAGLAPSLVPPDVGDGDVLVEGVSDAEDGWTAVTGVASVVDGPVLDATLTLVVREVLPGSAPPRACPLTAGFSPAAGGSWTDVPAHACDRAVAGEVTADGARVVFAGLAGFVDGSDELRALVVPGGPGRHVFAAPGEGALVVSPARAPAPAPAPSTAAATPSPVLEEPASFLPFPTLTPTPADVGAPPAHGASAGPVDDAQPAGTFSPFVPPADDAATRALTALVLGVVLGAFTVMQRGTTSRLRPARVGWQGAHEHVQA